MHRYDLYVKIMYKFVSIINVNCRHISNKLFIHSFIFQSGNTYVGAAIHISKRQYIFWSSNTHFGAAIIETIYLTYQHDSGKFMGI